ncbi:hypothetical protein PORY_000300 [Pneumocystis oryctolagi]|uniref:Uncharacterized protein n=1 Tax=Pneumocystis oryctolagi TaxID=42067 RepID=A0ACB7CHH8_9ASCO|nr:hypothetical protein PORY_000300 [Pneumocystis oryctolagi]
MLKTVHLQSLFDKIQKLSHTNTFDCRKNDTIKNLLKEAQEIHGIDNFKSFFECEAKQILYDVAVKEDSTLSQDEKFAKFYPILDASIVGQQNDILDDMLPFILFEDLMDLHIVSDCNKLFDFLNSRISFLTENGINGTKGKGLVLLRLCNELLRRLSKTKDSLFCGNVLMFLSNVFPLGERSGLNLRGDFHVENVTVLDDLKNIMNEDLKKMDEILKEDGLLNIKEKRNEIHEHEKREKNFMETFYTIFWSTQKFFSDPSLLYNSKEFQEFKSNTSVILDKIKSLEDEHLKTNEVKSESRKGDRKKKVDSFKHQLSQDYLQTYFSPKFLTNYKLLKLELSDPKFRKQILIQYLILLDYLSTLTETEKNKLEKTKAINRLLQPTYLLSQEDELWVNETLSKVNNILGSTVPDGQYFLQCIHLILSYEKNWVNWKLQGCSSFEEAPIPESYIEDIRKKCEKLSEPPKAYKYPLGNLTLTRLWEKGGTHAIENMSVPENFTHLNLKKLLEYSDQDTNSEAKDGNNFFSSEKNTVKSWKALKILSHSKLHLFNKLNDQTLEAITQIEEFMSPSLDKNTSNFDKSFEKIQKSPQKSYVNVNNKRIIEQETENDVQFEKRAKMD